MGKGKYNVESKKIETLKLFWLHVDAIADVMEKGFNISCVADGVITLELLQDGYYYELNLVTDDIVTSGDTIHGELWDLNIEYASFKVFDEKQKRDWHNGVLLDSCFYKKDIA